MPTTQQPVEIYDGQHNLEIFRSDLRATAVFPNPPATFKQIEIFVATTGMEAQSVHLPITRDEIRIVDPTGKIVLNRGVLPQVDGNGPPQDITTNDEFLTFEVFPGQPAFDKLSEMIGHNHVDIELKLNLPKAGLPVVTRVTARFH